MNEWILEMVSLALSGNGKIVITKEQFDQLEAFVFGYMAAAKMSDSDKKISESLVSVLDSKWESLFNVVYEHNKG